jgi:hypothetical protein
VARVPTGKWYQPDIASSADSLDGGVRWWGGLGGCCHATTNTFFQPCRIRCCGVVRGPQASAQVNATPEPLKFEVASIKVAASGNNGVRGGCRGVDTVYSAAEQERGGIPAMGRCRITDARLSHLIGIAYRVSMQVLETGPDWVQRGDLRFDVEAKAENPASVTRQQLLAMLQNLLVERFQIKFHYVTKEEPF